MAKYPKYIEIKKTFEMTIQIDREKYSLASNGDREKMMQEVMSELFNKDHLQEVSSHLLKSIMIKVI